VGRIDARSETLAEESWGERVTNSAIESHVYAWVASATPPKGSESRLTVTVTQAAVMLGISRTSAYERVRRGEIPTVRLGRRLLVPRGPAAGDAGR
jgi:excisionase family DNA binding protein